MSIELSSQGNISPDIERFNSDSYCIDGPSPMEEVTSALSELRVNFQSRQTAALNELILKTKKDGETLPDFINRQFTFGLRAALLNLPLTPISYKRSGEVFSCSRIVLGNDTICNHLSPTGISGDCLTMSTAIEQTLSEPHNFPGNEFIGHGNIKIPIIQSYYRIFDGLPILQLEHQNNWTHTFPIIKMEGRLISVDPSNFYGNFIIKQLLGLAIEGFIPMPIQPEIGTVPALTIPIAQTQPCINGGSKPYCEFQNSDGSTTISNFRLFPNEGRFAAQVELINQPEVLTENSSFPSLCAFLIPGQEVRIFPGAYQIGYFNGFIPGLVNIPSTNHPPTEMSVHISQIADEFQNIILPKLNG